MLEITIDGEKIMLIIGNIVEIRQTPIDGACITTIDGREYLISESYGEIREALNA